MTTSIRFLLRNTIWTVGAYGFGQVLRLVTNIALARLLAPQLFGIMTIVNSVRIGIEFMSDVGIGQNIVYNKNANEPDFYNTAWTLQVIRSVGVFIVALALTIPIARFYNIPILLSILPLMALTSLIVGFNSIGLLLIQKRLQVVKLNLFDVVTTVIGSSALLLFAYYWRSIWALVFGFLLGCVVTTLGSYLLLPDVTQRFYLSKEYTKEILHYGKWVFAASVVYFLSTNFDRLYFAKVVSLGELGVYGIARSMSEVLGMTILRFGNFVLFPFIASHSHLPRPEFRDQLVPIRAKFLLVAGVAFSIMSALADLPIKFLYDARYQAAAWMLPLLVIGSWFSLLANVNEAKLLGLGKPFYSAVANSAKFAFLLIGLPIGVSISGLLGGISVVAVSDLFRYVPILIGQRREGFSFGSQDLLFTLAVFVLAAFCEWLRWAFGFGYSFESLPI